jgi:hypothetical protein
VTPAEREIVGRFVKGERLREMPARPAPRLLVLRWLVERFVVGQRYSEREVNTLLGQAHPDFAMCRRYLVDHGLLDRGGGEYWRLGVEDEAP